LTRTPTLSQSFDIGDFIAPDILSVVDAGVRAVAADIIERGGLAGDIERIIDLRTATPIISDESLSGLVPSMNPDEFMPYEQPKAPVMYGFDEFEANDAPEEPVLEMEPETEPAFEAEDAAEEPVVTKFDTFDIDVKIPDLGNIEQTAALVQEDIVIEIPEVSRFNANLFKVKRDTLWFDEKFKSRVRLGILITVIVVVEALLIIYLLTP